MTADMPVLGAIGDRHQLSKTSLHAGHDPSNPRVAMVEEMAIDQCGGCAHGELRWRDQRNGQFLHPDEFGIEAEECEAHNTLRIAIDHGVPLYVGAEIYFGDDDDGAAPHHTGETGEKG